MGRVVLQGSRQGLSQPGRWVRDIIGALRLQCWIRQLAGGLECPEEGLVLLQQGQGLPSSSWRVRLSRSVAVALTMTPSQGTSSGVIGRCRFRDYPAHVSTKPQRRRSRHLPALIRLALVGGVEKYRAKAWVGVTVQCG